MTQTIYIKNMVCPRCKTAVTQIIQKLGAEVLGIELGKVQIEAMQGIDFYFLSEELGKQGFELLETREVKLANQVKSLVIEYLVGIEHINIKLSKFLAAKTNLTYSYLSKIFSQVEKMTIEQYFILLRLEKVKERLSYQEPLSQIAIELGFSSPQALSNHFKAKTGLTAKEFTKNRIIRKSLAEL